MWLNWFEVERYRTDRQNEILREAEGRHRIRAAQSSDPARGWVHLPAPVCEALRLNARWCS
jgi:hypothetical protein